MQLFILFFSLLFFFNNVLVFSNTGTEGQADSLKQVIQSEKNPEKKVDALNNLYHLLSRENADDREPYYEEALRMAKENGYAKGEIDAYNLKGESFSDMGQFSSSIEMYLKAKKLAEEKKLEKELAVTLENIGVAYFYLGEYDTATSYFQEAIPLLVKTNNVNEIVYSYGCLGSIWLSKEEYANAMKYFQQGIRIADSAGVEERLSVIYGNVGILYERLGRYEDALNYGFKNLALREKNNNVRGQITGLNNISVIYKKMGNYPEARKHLDHSMLLAEKLNNPVYIASCNLYLGLLHQNISQHDSALICLRETIRILESVERDNQLAQAYVFISWSLAETKKYREGEKYALAALEFYEKDSSDAGIAQALDYLAYIYSEQKLYDKGIATLKQGLQFADRSGNFEQIANLNKSLFELYEKMGKYKEAFEHLSRYEMIEDSLVNTNNTVVSAELEAIYQNEKRELQIENLNKDNAIKESEIKKQNTQKIAFASGFGLMLVLAFVIFRGYRQKQKANEIITAQKTEVEKQKEIVEEKNREILDSVRYAQRIQETILPPAKLVKQYLSESFVLYKPKDIVAGDFYWMHPFLLAGEGQGEGILFAVCDCTGHGVPGAFVSIVGHNALNRAVKEYGLREPAKILDKVNELVEEAFSGSENDIKDGMDIALCALEFPSSPGKKGSMRLQYAGANNSVYHIRNGMLNEIKADKQPIGKYASRKPFVNNIIELQEGDAIYVFTDGYADQFGGPKGKKFKYSQFEKLLVSICGRSMEEQKNILNDTIEKWKCWVSPEGVRSEVQQIDDICIIGIKVNA